mmetsp:Transcript_17806/g.40703  ORF Transcript_17806/g.40703 Transcript_17806/m.40703 type:complete len:230 (+) Transcript_17806:157-846(+)
MFPRNRIINPVISRASIRTKTRILSNQQQRQCTVRSFFSSNQRHNKQTQMIINAVGTDRLGIVHDMTKEVIDAGGNVGASQAAKLGEYFSLMMLVEVPESKIESLKESLSQMQDLSASVCSTKESEGATTFASSSSYTIGYKGELTLEGADNPGIVHKVTKILSTNGLNIDKMETTDELAPGGGAVLFRMRGIAHAYEPLSAGFEVSKIKQELAELGDHLNCDIELTDV